MARKREFIRKGKWFWKICFLKSGKEKSLKWKKKTEREYIVESLVSASFPAEGSTELIQSRLSSSEEETLAGGARKLASTSVVSR